MTRLSREIFDNWQIRKKYEQKTAFIELLQSHIPEAKVEQKGKKGSRNIVIGDVESADVVLTAHYDTCSVMPFPNFLTPKNILFYIVYQLLVVGVMLAVAFGAGALVEHLTDSFEAGYFAGLILYFVLLFAMMKGPANRHTANDNTSGVITLLEIYEAMSPEQRTKTCFVFFDHEETGLVGSSFFAKKHKAAMKEKLLINFDCVSDGDHMMLVIKRKAEKAYGEALRGAFLPEGEKKMLFEKAATTVYPSDQANFPMALAVSCFNRKPVIGYYMDKIHTPRDTVFDERNITLLRNCVLRFMDGI